MPRDDPRSRLDGRHDRIGQADHERGSHRRGAVTFTVAGERDKTGEYLGGAYWAHLTRPSVGHEPLSPRPNNALKEDADLD